MNAIFSCNLICCFLAFNRFQCYLCLQLCTVSFSLSWHFLLLVGTSLDTVILSDQSVQFLIDLSSFLGPLYGAVKTFENFVQLLYDPVVKGMLLSETNCVAFASENQRTVIKN